MRLRRATSEAILVAAEEIFADQGLHSAHMGDIAAAAGVAVGTLYNHFKDREALLLGLLAARRAEVLAQLDLQVGRAGGRFAEQLESVARGFLDYFLRHRKFFRILFEGELGGASYPTAGKKPREMLREILERIDKLMKRGVRQRVLRPELAAYYPALFMGVIRAIMVRDLFLDGSGVPMAADGVVRFFLSGAER